MMRRLFTILTVISAILIVWGCNSSEKTEPAGDKTSAAKPAHVLMETSMGEIELELFPEKAPAGVKNFQDYVKSGFYDGTIFHRVIYGFMIQGGGYPEDLSRKETNPPIPYEGDNGLQNLRGTIAYARTNDPNSATSQFFINHRDNLNLDHGNTPDGYGYAVFGKVVRGMDVVDRIASTQVGTRPNGMQNVPVKPIIISKVTFVK